MSRRAEPGPLPRGKAAAAYFYYYSGRGGVGLRPSPPPFFPGLGAASERVSEGGVTLNS